jgi:hypothetical protein
VELHTALKVRAAIEGPTIGELFEELISSWAGKHRGMDYLDFML